MSDKNIVYGHIIEVKQGREIFRFSGELSIVPRIGEHLNITKYVEFDNRLRPLNFRYRVLDITHDLELEMYHDPEEGSDHHLHPAQSVQIQVEFVKRWGLTDEEIAKGNFKPVADGRQRMVQLKQLPLLEDITNDL